MKTLKLTTLLIPFFALSAACASDDDKSTRDAQADDNNSDATSGEPIGDSATDPNGEDATPADNSEAGLDATPADPDATDRDGSEGDATDDDAQANAQAPVPLGMTSTFAVLAAAEITNIPTSMITGDVGLTPDTAANVTGFSMPATCPEVTGTVYVVDATGPACAVVSPVVLAAAKSDAALAFTNARAATRGTPQAIAGDLNGLTLYPGLYESGSSLELSPGGFLYLDAQGDDAAVFIIRSETSITTESTSEVVLANGAKASNVYWTAATAVTLGTDSIMKGTLIAGTAISLLTGANLEGRALNQGAAAEAITLDSCTITVPQP